MKSKGTRRTRSARGPLAGNRRRFISDIRQRALGAGLGLLFGTMPTGCSAGGGASNPAGTGGTGGTPEAPEPSATTTGTTPVPTSVPTATSMPTAMPTSTGAGGTGGAPPAPTGTTEPPPFGGYDPTVQFDWEETTPSAGSCKAGAYQGAFAGTYLSPIAILLPVPITGTVTHRLEAASSGEFLEIRDGRVDGTAETPIGPVPFSADFTGQLNCDMARMENGYLRNGVYTDPNTMTEYYFEGPVEAQYDKLANQFINGTWVVGEPTYTMPPPLYGGNGTWGSQWSGP